MDSHQHFRYGVTGVDISYKYSHITSAIPEWTVGPLKFNSESLPNSPLSTHFECDTFTSLSNSQEQYNSTENLAAVSPLCNSSLEANSSFRWTSHSPVSLQDHLEPCSGGSLLSQNANCGQSIKHFLQELESTLMGPDGDEDETTTSNTATEGINEPQISCQASRSWSQEPCHDSNVIQPQQSFVPINRTSSNGVHAEKRHRAIEVSSQEVRHSDLKQLLIECAKALSENRTDDFKKLVHEARSAVSVTGEPIQRLGAYMVEGLVARKEASGTNIYRALQCREPESQELLSYMQILYEICPYFKFGYMAANGAIAEAFKNEDRIHIIDFQIAQGSQWVTLIQALAARPSGPPHVRITGIDDPVSQYARGDSLEVVGRRLAAISEKFNIPVEFHAVPVFASEVKPEMLKVRPGEALAVNFTLQLHHTPDESVDVNNPRDGLLRMVRSLSPKVVTLVEQESNTNTTPFFMRFMETLDYYSAMFESIDVTLPRDSRERINVEQHCLARDIVNVIACEGKERVERHELLGKWKSRLTMAGFLPYPLSSYVNSVIRSLLRCYSEHYTLVEKDGVMLLGWKHRHLISASAWH
ncbi:chitin-inducible gibberellin-responsive protein 1-like isoform X3 [Macadamia integrifolia]|uniref:chitin-inducible gibberellin-responsive protein 1-like isoform X1 n=1 Tax=Macadamia integrifolia TaxID=60698 RepID=UPI001C4FAFEB|nr:chitin-inducible gibberellin-responsive protein 1-like isoform X1 [Macadamia integrifolia]XP_042486413.1 chitin-inducible gibberellin-responsive protein 1-like isoform X1 [Macadamia integrifolia]XP_042486415.1 chitin-inducible gibberellin-responsive protein 1-like isoform X2 [Macadamia integrifolia]XP_042486416.1 chitin-inducible gibberellin-responsive protein 1-like isoform X1 [Macadamia integrifolia]XP_042486417.1 chitin-inducible gibberellin-responsive protein 1-like isoform X1 [Macadamia